MHGLRKIFLLCKYINTLDRLHKILNLPKPLKHTVYITLTQNSDKATSNFSVVL